MVVRSAVCLGHRARTSRNEQISRHPAPAYESLPHLRVAGLCENRRQDYTAVVAEAVETRASTATFASVAAVSGLPGDAVGAFTKAVHLAGLDGAAGFAKRI